MRRRRRGSPRKVIEKIRAVTDKPIKYVVLSHYHAVRVLGASAYGASEIIMSAKARAMVAERGQEDWDREFQRFPRLFQGHESIPGLTWPTLTFNDQATFYLGKRRVDSALPRPRATPPATSSPSCRTRM